MPCYKFTWGLIDLNNEMNIICIIPIRNKMTRNSLKPNEKLIKLDTTINIVIPIDGTTMASSM
tara:strand:+ start:1153 stop:1341 length:189 start_codon:yes stop_codon:yes gene_type:complete